MGSGVKAGVFSHLVDGARCLTAMLCMCAAEAGYVAGDGELGDNVTEFKLVDVPELGYHTTNQPFPQVALQRHAACGHACDAFLWSFQRNRYGRARVCCN